MIVISLLTPLIFTNTIDFKKLHRKTSPLMSHFFAKINLGADCLAVVLAVLFVIGSQATAGDFPQPYRFGVEASAEGHARQNHPAKVAVDFSAILQTAGITGSLNHASLRVVEVGPSGETLDENVPFQFDPVQPGVGELIYSLTGQTPASATRRYQVYFDTAGDYTAPTFGARVKLVGTEMHEAQMSYKIETYDDPQQSASSTWFYHKQGGGFASLEDKDGDDWLGYHPTGGGAGNFRGIPNLGHPGDFFHPGGTAAISRVVSEGPLRVTIASETADGQWSSVWEMYPDFAHMTVLKAPRPYWFLYEGTPGGEFERETDIVVRSDGQSILAGSGSWRNGTNELADPEWIYFGDPASGDDGRSLFFVHHEDDDAPDTYRPFGSDMTVFGFGRLELEKHLTGVSHFTVGLVDEIAYDQTKPIIEGAYLPMAISLGPLEVIPEPSTLSLLAIVLFLSPRRKRHH